MKWLCLCIVTVYMIIPSSSSSEGQQEQEKIQRDDEYPQYDVPPPLDSVDQIWFNNGSYGLTWRDVVKVEDHYNSSNLSNVSIYYNN